MSWLLDAASAAVFGTGEGDDEKEKDEKKDDEEKKVAAKKPPAKKKKGPPPIKKTTGTIGKTKVAKGAGGAKKKEIKGRSQSPAGRRLSATSSGDS